MPKPRYNQKDVNVMRAMRRSGFSYSEIESAFNYDVPVSTIIYFTQDVEVHKDGKRALLRWVKDTAAKLEPGRPIVQPPLPSGLLALWEEQSEEKK